MSNLWSTLTNEITKTIIYSPHLHTLATPSKAQSNPNLHQNKDNDFINRHHSVTFNRTSIHHNNANNMNLNYPFLLRGDEKIP